MQSTVQILDIPWVNFLTEVHENGMSDFALLMYLLNSLDNLSSLRNTTDLPGIHNLIIWAVSLLNPRMVQTLCRCDPLVIILDKASHDKILATFTYVIERGMLEMIFSFDDIVNNLWLGSSRERNLSWKHDVEDDAHRPNINWRVVGLKEDLWCNVVWRTTHRVHRFICVLQLFWKAKIYHFNGLKIICFE